MKEINFYSPNDIGEFYLGRVVKLKRSSSFQDECQDIIIIHNMIGHVVGFSNNQLNEVVILVQTAIAEDPQPFHPSNLELMPCGQR